MTDEPWDYEHELLDLETEGSCYDYQEIEMLNYLPNNDKGNYYDQLSC